MRPVTSMSSSAIPPIQVKEALPRRAYEPIPAPSNRHGARDQHEYLRHPVAEDLSAKAVCASADGWRAITAGSDAHRVSTCWALADGYQYALTVPGDHRRGDSARDTERRRGGPNGPPGDLL
jgi:hypothetical protein